MTTKLLLPLLNRTVTMFKGPTWYLSERVSIEAISTEDHGIVFRYAPPEYQSLLSPKSKCIRIEAVDERKCDDIAKIEGTIISFLLNYFKSSHPISLSFAIQIKKNPRSQVLKKIIDLPFVVDTRSQRTHNYRIRDNVPRGNISDFYKVISKVNEKYPGILLTLDRFSAALFRTGDYDKIIDITISLESLIRGTTELQHKFSLYNSWAAEADNNNRRKCQELLRALYNARSAIVHGTAMSQKEYDKKIKPVLDKWNDVIKIAEKALGYHLLYIYDNDIDKWHEHQESLSLGIAERITW